tara:strand:- start:169 stop:318 length:150 start_codon:yes stop_codon:yes gene_type:complete
MDNWKILLGLAFFIFILSYDPKSGQLEKYISKGEKNDMPVNIVGSILTA